MSRMNAIEIAVVIVTYKSAELAIECLASIQSERETQDLKIRVVLVDNASGDLAQIRQVEWISHPGDAAPLHGKRRIFQATEKSRQEYRRTLRSRHR